ncbi:unnamed protein product [Oncorhynchus mykiss]|uniref:Secreted protein n=1 Tax=Oncorhynchus mykiss TaxID=8022 RepID=A0A060WSJ2_ONCMY|nr:unnamed protein product [Oncorhynchus mykiss]
MGVLVCGVVVLTLICQSHSLDGATNPLHRFKRYQESASSEPNDCTTRTRQPMVLSKSGNFSLDVRMPGVSPTAAVCKCCMSMTGITNNSWFGGRRQYFYLENKETLNRCLRIMV